jgi:hypothetical protein
MNSYDLIMLISSLLTALGGILWVYVAVVTYRGQMYAQVFLDCNARYEAIMASFPRDAIKWRLNIKEDLPPPSVDLTLSVMKYLNLSAEEYYLYRTGYVHKNVWNVWRKEMERTIRSPLIRREWSLIEKEFVEFPEFKSLVEELLNKNVTSLNA